MTDFAFAITTNDALTPALGRAAKALTDLQGKAAGGVDLGKTIATLQQLGKAANAAAAAAEKAGGASNQDRTRFQAMAGHLGEARRHAVEMGKTLDDMRRRAGAGVRWLGDVLPIGMLTGAASLGGLVALAERLAKSGEVISRTSAAIAVPTTALQRLQGAGEFSGISPETTAAGLAAIGEHLHAAAYGQDVAVLNALHDPRFRFGKITNPDGSIMSPDRFLREQLLPVAHGISDPYAQRQLLAMFGGEAFQPLAHLGMAGVSSRMAGAPFMDPAALEKAIRLNDAWVQLEQAARGAGLAIGVALAPALEKLARYLADPATIKAIGDETHKFLAWIEGIDFGKVDSALGKVDAILTKLNAPVSATGILAILAGAGAANFLTGGLLGGAARMGGRALRWFAGTAAGAFAGGAAIGAGVASLRGDTANGPGMADWDRQQAAGGAGVFGQGGTLERWLTGGVLPARGGVNAAINPALLDIARRAAARLPAGYRAEIISGERSGGLSGSQHHAGADGLARALDVQIYGPDGRPISNRGDDRTGIYTRFARLALGAQLATHPELTGQLGWGGMFETTPGSGERDLMHLDIGGDRGRWGRLFNLGPLDGASGDASSLRAGGALTRHDIEITLPGVSDDLARSSRSNALAPLLAPPRVGISMAH